MFTEKCIGECAPVLMRNRASHATVETLWFHSKDNCHQPVKNQLAEASEVSSLLHFLTQRFVQRGSQIRTIPHKTIVFVTTVSWNKGCQIQIALLVFSKRSKRMYLKLECLLSCVKQFASNEFLPTEPTVQYAFPSCFLYKETLQITTTKSLLNPQRKDAPKQNICI